MVNVGIALFVYLANVSRSFLWKIGALAGAVAVGDTGASPPPGGSRPVRRRDPRAAPARGRQPRLRIRRRRLVETGVQQSERDWGTPLAVDADGAFVGGGMPRLGPALRAVVARFTAGGELDATFGDAGRVVLPLTPETWTAVHPAIGAPW